MTFTLPAFGDEVNRQGVSPRRVELPPFGGPVNITSPWLLVQGDDPAYGDPKFDDSRWTVVTPGVPLENYGFHDLNYIWYRKHLHLAPGAHDLALMELNLFGTSQIFVNGLQVGGFGRQIEGGDFTYMNAKVISIPDLPLGGGEMTVAIRVSMRRSHEFDPMLGGFGPNCFLRIGDAADIAEAFSLFRFRAFTSDAVNFLLKLLLTILAMVLALTLRREKEYLALLVWSASSTLIAGYDFWWYFHNFPDSLFKAALKTALLLISYAGLFEFIRIVLKLSRSRLLSAYVVLYLVSVFASNVAVWRWAYFGDGTNYPFLIRGVAQIIWVPYVYGLPFLALWAAVRKHNRDALLLFFPLLFESGDAFYFGLRSVLIRFHGPILSIPMNLVPGLYFQWSEVATFFYNLTLLVFVVLRTVSIAGNRAKIAAEVEAARTMQRLLLARSSEPIPGFDVETVYRPAGEVGGDFFLVSPGPDDSLTAIVGDVSGKGLAAAMRVSMILGVLRREDSRDPGTILARLNEALLAQSEAGFTTACCVRLNHGGSYTVANAGHISPYISGLEIETPPAVPLGLTGDQVYVATEGQLRAGERLVLMSDGVVEARSAKGELYGFARLAVLSVKCAREIADVAQEFGQDDDITVLTIACA